LERKLTAILCADVYGYSRLMGQDEEATLRTLSSHRKLIDSLIAQHRGRFVNSAGDSILAEFVSVVNAVQCAVAIQSTLRAENAEVPPEKRMQFRIGVNLGDVMVEDEQISGDGSTSPRAWRTLRGQRRRKSNGAVRSFPTLRRATWRWELQ
jgi:class 3 adenylate cyclase